MLQQQIRRSDSSVKVAAVSAGGSLLHSKVLLPAASLIKDRSTFFDCYVGSFGKIHGICLTLAEIKYPSQLLIPEKQLLCFKFHR